MKCSKNIWIVCTLALDTNIANMPWNTHTLILKFWVSSKMEYGQNIIIRSVTNDKYFVISFFQIRAGKIDFMCPFFQYGYDQFEYFFGSPKDVSNMLLIQKTVGVGLTATSFLSVFDVVTWALVALSTLLVSVIFLMVYHFSQEDDKRKGVRI